MVCISTVYRFTVFLYFNLDFSDEENQGQGQHEENVTSEVRFSEVHLLLYFREITFLTSLRFLQISRIQILCHVPFFMLTSEHLEYILENTKVQTEQRFYRGFTVISILQKLAISLGHMPSDLISNIRKSCKTDSQY
jgi:hypothetical protein